MKSNNTYIFLRHGETVKDPNTPAINWGLTDETQEALNKLAAESAFDTIEVIYSSNEHKAIKSAEPFAKKLGISIQQQDGLEEVHRGEAYLSDEEFKALKQTKLEDRDSNPDGGESSNTALKRFIAAMEEIDRNHENETILISSHGTILALYFCHVAGDFTNIFDYWGNIPFCGVGIIRGGEVIQHISQ